MSIYGLFFSDTWYFVVVIKPYVLVDLLNKIKFMKIKKLELAAAKAQGEE